MEMYCVKTIKYEIKDLVGLVPPEGSNRKSVPCLFLASGDSPAIFGIPWLTDASLQSSSITLNYPCISSHSFIFCECLSLCLNFPFL